MLALQRDTYLGVQEAGGSEAAAAMTMSGWNETVPGLAEPVHCRKVFAFLTPLGGLGPPPTYPRDSPDRGRFSCPRIRTSYLGRSDAAVSRLPPAPRPPPVTRGWQRGRGVRAGPERANRSDVAKKGCYGYSSTGSPDDGSRPTGKPIRGSGGLGASILGR
ncbi:hypothetical protein LX36DRAFT_85924 [Colletotrichum falcatum]|nr:hypothetical protein LX36DRAFT_85924 [Colletotrichum falcatum]